MFHRISLIIQCLSSYFRKSNIPQPIAGIQRNHTFLYITNTTSVGLNTPGQSGDVASPHYRDLYPLWARGRYFPVFFSRDKIETVTEKTLKLEPQN